MEGAGVNSNGRDSRSRGRKKSNSGGGLYKNYKKAVAAPDVRENGSRSRQESFIVVKGCPKD